jgi:hypothetical protein
VSRQKLNQRLELVRERLKAAKLKNIAVRADADAIVERIRRANAERQGIAYEPDPVPNFVPSSRSSHTH